MLFSLEWQNLTKKLDAIKFDLCVKDYPYFVWHWTNFETLPFSQDGILDLSPILVTSKPAYH